MCATTFCFSLHLYVLQAYCLLLSFLICAKSRVFNSRLSFVRLSCVLIFHFVPVLRLAVSVEVCSFSHFFFFCLLLLLAFDLVSDLCLGVICVVDRLCLQHGSIDFMAD